MGSGGSIAKNVSVMLSNKFTLIGGIICLILCVWYVLKLMVRPSGRGESPS